MSEENSDFWVDTWPGRFLLNSVGYILVFCPIIIGLFITKKILKLDPTIITESIWKKGLIWFYFGKRSEALQTEGEAKNEVEEDQSDLNSGQSLLEDELEVDKELGQSTIEESNRQKERKKFLLKALTLFGCASGLWSSLIFYGLLQERIFKNPYNHTCLESRTNCTEDQLPEKFKHTQFVLFLNRLLATITTFIYLMIFQRYTNASVGFYKFSFASTSNLFSAWFRFEALKLVSFTTVTLAKGTRLFPIMLVNKIINKKSFKFIDWFTAFLLCSGSIIFMYSKEVAKCGDSCSESENSFGITVSISGFICLVIYVGTDSFTSNWQENLFSHNVEGLELAFGVSLFTTILTGVSLLLQGGFSKAYEFIANHEEIGFHLFGIMLCSTISQIAIAFTIKNFGAVVFTILMIGRIIPQVLLSYFVYDAVFEVWGWVGIGIVFCGLILKLILKCYQFYKNLKTKNV